MQAIALDTSEPPQTTTPKRRSAPLSPEVADRLLDLLSTDDDFRFHFSAAPLEALKTVGYQTTGGGPEPFQWCEIGILASKEAIRAARAELKLVLMNGSAYTAPQLNAGNVSERLIRKTLA